GQGSPVAADPAIAEVPAEGLPLLAGVGGPRGVRAAARAGVGILLTSLRAPAEAAQLVRAYRQAGGVRPVVLIRRGTVRPGAAGFGSSTAAWQSRAGSASWLQATESALITGPPDAVGQQLAEAVRVSGCTALDLRLDAYAADPDRVADQISLIAGEVLP